MIYIANRNFVSRLKNEDTLQNGKNLEEKL